MFQEPAERTNTENHYWMLVIFGHSDDTALKADVILSWKSLNWLWNTLRQSLKQTEAKWKEVLWSTSNISKLFLGKKLTLTIRLPMELSAETSGKAPLVLKC